MRADGQPPMASPSPAVRHASGSHALHRQCSWVAAGAGSRVGGGEAHTGRRASVEMGPMAAVLTALQQAGQAQHLPAELSMVARGPTEAAPPSAPLSSSWVAVTRPGPAGGQWTRAGLSGAVWGAPGKRWGRQCLPRPRPKLPTSFPPASLSSCMEGAWEGMQAGRP
ncbi:hypothetical protein HaLaN_17715 [Haematococcus lacustris]|uniref:Uncharacterized protein n=1 Tax=Haematococcus lacustris TaxID=44745 RepID=A0A699ZX86_HAELA|nr:hypothetical protein HaLaN_17715 [Haematococcus lacustris]